MLIGFIFALYIGRIDYAIRGIAIGIPAILAAFLLLVLRKDDSSDENPIVLFTINNKILYACFGFCYALSIISLWISLYRTIFYFILVISLFSLIAFQLMSPVLRPTVIISQIILVMVNLSYGITLNYPLYFAWTDTLDHIVMIDVTKLTGHIIPMDLAWTYAQFPLYHIFFSINALFLYIPSQSALFLVSSVPYVLLILIIYLLFKQITNNEQISLLSCFLYSLIPVVIFYNAYIITRVFAYIGFVIFFYLIYLADSRKKKLEFLFLVLILIIFLIIVHQVSIAQISLLLILLIVSEWIVSDKKIIRTWYMFFILITFISYWTYASFEFLKKVIQNRMSELLSESVLMVKPSIQVGNEWTFLWENSGVSIMTFFIILGIGILVWKYRKNYISFFGIFALFTIVFFIPNPMQLLWANMTVFRSDRFMLLLAPFFAFVMSWGLYSVFKVLKNKGVPIRIMGMTFLLVIISFAFTGIAISNGSDSKDLILTGSREYFNQHDLSSFEHIVLFCPDGSNLYSDSYVNRFFLRKFSLSEELQLPYYSTQSINFNYDDEISGYQIIRYDEFLSKGLYFATNIPGYVEKFNPDDENIMLMEKNRILTDKIYDNKDVSISHL
jgi:hypothetical protein